MKNMNVEEKAYIEQIKLEDKTFFETRKNK